MRTAIRALLLVAGALGAASCRESGTGADALEAGAFQATVSGHETEDLTGTAYLYDGDSFLPGRRLVLTTGDHQAEITIWGGGILTSGSDFDFQEGRHAVGVLADVQADLTLEPFTTVGNMYIARDGTLRVTRSTSERVAGEFDFNGVVHRPDGSTRTVRVRGAFHAVPNPMLGTRHARARSPDPQREPGS